MTYTTDNSLAEIKTAATQMGIVEPVGDRRKKTTWLAAIESFQVEVNSIVTESLDIATEGAVAEQAIEVGTGLTGLAIEVVEVLTSPTAKTVYRSALVLFWSICIVLFWTAQMAVRWSRDTFGPAIAQLLEDLQKTRLWKRGQALVRLARVRFDTEFRLVVQCWAIDRFSRVGGPIGDVILDSHDVLA